MKTTLGIAFAWLTLTGHAVGQGSVDITTYSARTRTGTIDGLFAGTNIFGQLFAGHSPDSLAPVDAPYYHRDGYVYAGVLRLWGYPQGSTPHVQLWAWDWTVWGAAVDAVPPSQFGKTDILEVYLPYGTQYAFTEFTQPAIVPLVPEPAASVLGLMSASLFWLRWRCSRRLPFLADMGLCRPVRIRRGAVR